MTLKRLIAHWQDEGESAFLYKILASLEPSDRKKRIFAQLAEVELRHQRTFLHMITDRGAHVGEWSPGASRPSSGVAGETRERLGGSLPSHLR